MAIAPTRSAPRSPRSAARPTRSTARCAARTRSPPPRRRRSNGRSPPAPTAPACRRSMSRTCRSPTCRATPCGCGCGWRARCGIRLAGNGAAVDNQERDMTSGEIGHRTIETNGIHMHLAEQGEGPLVVLCHGFPESWYSWRHQLPALAEAGFHAVAPDMRGYGQTGRPEAIDQYTLLHLVGDMVGLVDALGAEEAVIAGHDWGSPVAWHAALLRPDRFRGVICLSVPYRPRGPVRPTTVMPQSDEAIFYQLYFQTPGVAEAEFERDIRLTLRRLLYSASGDGPRGDASLVNPDTVGMVPRRGGFLSRRMDPPSLPPWLTEADVEFFAGEFTRTGF